MAKIQQAKNISFDLWRRANDSGFPETMISVMANRFKLLSEPMRLKLIAALKDGEKSVGELVAQTDAGQPNVSKHLTALLQGGIVSRRKQGTTIYYSISDNAIIELCDLVCSSAQRNAVEQALAIGATSDYSTELDTKIK